jgi:predicted GTPase
VVYAGVDYRVILEQAQAEADVVVWDGGNNDLPFIRPSIHITLVDPHRPGHEVRYHPGETNLRMATSIVMNKIDTADLDDIMAVRSTVRKVNPRAVLVEAASPVTVEDPGSLEGRRVLVIEDGPTVTHGEMAYGAGTVAARRFGAEPVDPRPHAVGSLQQVFRRYAHLTQVLPAMGYGRAQVRELEATIRATPCDAVLIATPIDLRRLMAIVQPSLRVRYELQEIGRPDLRDVLKPITG